MLWQFSCCGQIGLSLDGRTFLSKEKQKLFSVASSKWSPLRWFIDLFWCWSSGFKLMVDEVILKKQVTSYFLEKSITAITKVITDVWRKGWARSLEALGLGLRDPLASLDQGEFLIDAVRTVPASEHSHGWMINSWMRSDNIRTTTSSWATSRRQPRLTSRWHGALARRGLIVLQHSASGPDHAEWHAAAVIVCEQWSLQGFAGQYRDGRKSFS